MAATTGLPMLYGYACTSSDDPRLVAQRAALSAAGCTKIFEERGSWPRVRARLALAHALDTCATGDALIVARLDRLGRSPTHVTEIISNLTARGVAVRALAENLDTAAPGSAAAVRFIVALAAFQHATTTRGERLRLSPNGRGPIVRPLRHSLPRGGRPGARKITPEQIARAQAMIKAGRSCAAAARTLGVAYKTLLVAPRKAQEGDNRAAAGLGNASDMIGPVPHAFDSCPRS